MELFHENGHLTSEGLKALTEAAEDLRRPELLLRFGILFPIGRIRCLKLRPGRLHRAADRVHGR